MIDRKNEARTEITASPNASGCSGKLREAMSALSATSTNGGWAVEITKAGMTEPQKRWAQNGQRLRI